MTSAYCETNTDDPEGLGLPLEIVLRDHDTGEELDVLQVHGPHYGEEGVTLLEGYDNFYHTDRTVVRESTAYEPGSTPTEIPRVEERLLTFQLGTQAASPRQWERVETRLWRCWSFSWDTYLRVYSWESEPREIACRLERKPKGLLKRGPGLNRFQVWEMTTLACDPFWYSEDYTFTVKRSQMTDIGGGVYEAMIPMLNPADQPMWMEFASGTLTASTTVWLPNHLTGSLVELPALGPGKEFLVSSNPLVETLRVRDGGQDWANMNARSFSDTPIPGGLVDPVMVPVRMSGGGPDTEIELTMRQQWDRCWGGEAE